MSAPGRMAGASALNRFAAESHLITIPLFQIAGGAGDYTPMVIRANRRFLVYHIYWQHITALTVTWFSGPSATGVALTAPLPSAGAYSWEFRNAGFPVWAGANPGQPLVCNFGSAGTIVGFVTYAEQEAGADF